MLSPNFAKIGRLPSWREELNHDTDEFFATDPTVILNMARSYFSQGNTMMGFLMAVIAAERTTIEFVNNRLKSKGISGRKIKEKKTDMTFSLYLDILLRTVMNDEEYPKELVSKINSARKKRNDIAHANNFNLSFKDAHEFMNVIGKYIHYLISLE